MRPIVIGAGRGSRLGPETDEVPKALVPVMGRPMLDWILDALGRRRLRPQGRPLHLRLQGRRRARALPRALVRREPRLGAQQHPRVAPLRARRALAAGSSRTYADIVYRGSTVKKLVASPHDKVLACDTDWRRRYVDRSQHPETDAEKMRAEGDRVVELSRRIAVRGGERRVHRRRQVLAPRARARWSTRFDEARARHDRRRRGARAARSSAPTSSISSRR